MTAVAELAPRSLFAAIDREPTLDDVLARAWTGLGAHSAVECPVCGGPMERHYGARSLPVGGHCRRCHSALH